LIFAGKLSIVRTIYKGLHPQEHFMLDFALCQTLHPVPAPALRGARVSVTQNHLYTPLAETESEPYRSDFRTIIQITG
jgi:hypothetical protein